MQTKTLEEILQAKSLITEDQVSSLRLESINTGDAVEDIIRRRKMVPDADLLKAKAEQLGIPFVTLGDKQIVGELLALVPQQTAQMYQIIPFELSKDGEWLSMAMADPLDVQLIEFLERKTKKRIKPFMADPQDIIQAVQEQYSTSLTSEVTEALKEVQPTVEKSTGAEAQVDEKGQLKIDRAAPVAQIVSTMLEYAIKMRASDVHIEPLEDHTRVRYRIDGILMEKLSLHRALHDAIISRIKILSGMKIDEKRIPQDGRFNFKTAGEEVDLRVSTLPIVYGEKVVMRLLKKSGKVPTLAELGVRGTALKNFEAQMLRPHGVILVTGPTGSGKTTTLYGVLTKLNTGKVNISTLEDPVEYQMPGVNQVQINPGVGLTFASGLRAFLRQDPNIIMVGEIRDKETTELAIQAALTGHLVFSTLHTNTAAGALPRMLDLGAEPFLIASSVNAVEAQRVVRKICDSCKTQYDPPDAVKKDLSDVLGALNSKDKIMLSKGNGCNECGGTGYLGRTGIYEVLPITEKIARLVLERSALGDIEKEAEAEGMVTMKQDGYLKAIEGITTLEEVLRVAQD